MIRKQLWLGLGLALFLAAWAVALLDDPSGEMGRVLLSAGLGVGGVLSLAKGGLLG